MSIDGVSPIMPIDRIAKVEPLHFDPTYRFFEALLNLEKTADSMMLLQMKELEGIQEQFKALAAERVQLGEKALDKKHISESWSLLHKAWTTIISAVSTVLGLSVMATPGGALVGGAMVASGSISIANLAAKETGAWNWVAKRLAADSKDAEERLAQWIPAAIDVSSSVIGLLGASSAILEQTLNLSAGTVNMAKTAGYFGEGVVSVAKGSYEAEARAIQADLEELTGRTDVNQHDLESITQRIERFSGLLGQSQSQASQLIKQAIKKV